MEGILALQDMEADMDAGGMNETGNSLCSNNACSYRNLDGYE